MSLPAIEQYDDEPEQETSDVEHATTKEKYDRLLRLLFEHAFKL